VKAWLGGTRGARLGSALAIRAKIPIQFVCLDNGKLVSLNESPETPMIIDCVWACWPQLSSKQILSIIPNSEKVEGRLKYINYNYVNEFLQTDKYINLRKGFIEESLKTLDIMLAITTEKECLLATLPAASMPWNNHADYDDPLKRANAQVIIDIHYHMARNFDLFMVKANAALGKKRHLVLYNTKNILKYTDIRNVSSEYVKYEPRMDCIGTHLQYKRDKSVIMITGESNHPSCTGNGALGLDGFSSFDERMSYLSPIAYRCMFCPEINPHIINNLSVKPAIEISVSEYTRDSYMYDRTIDKMLCLTTVKALYLYAEDKVMHTKSFIFNHIEIKEGKSICYHALTTAFDSVTPDVKRKIYENIYVQNYKSLLQLNIILDAELKKRCNIKEWDTVDDVGLRRDIQGRYIRYGQSVETLGIQALAPDSVSSNGKPDTTDCTSSLIDDL
jgi:hypothetical protein